MASSNKYFITLFKIEGHEQWRLNSAVSAEGFDEEAKRNKYPKITDRKVFVVDRITGEMSEVK